MAEDKHGAEEDFPRLAGGDEAAHGFEPRPLGLGMSFAQAHHAQRNAGRVSDAPRRAAQTLPQREKSDAAAAAAGGAAAGGAGPSAATAGGPAGPAGTPGKARAKNGRGLVKAVLTGDTIVLVGSAPPGQAAPPEKVVSLSGISAPRITRGKNGSDEPFGWASREALRRKCVGQMVSFSINYTHESSGHEYGIVKLAEENLSEFMVANGWATAKAGNKGKDGKLHPERQSLVDLEEKARAEEVGIFSKEKGSQIRTLEWLEHATPVQARQLADQYKGKVVNAVVDRVLDGDTIRLELIPDDKSLKHSIIILHLAGVQCQHMPVPYSVLKERYERELASNPNAPRNPPKEEAPPPLAVAARDFTELRLLNRDVGVVIRGADKTGNLFGSIQFSKGNIAAELIRNGLGQLVAWSAAMLPNSEQQQLRQAEDDAKRRNGGVNGGGGASALAPALSSVSISSSASAAAASASSGPAGLVPGKAFQSRVVQVVAGDVLLILDPDNGEERRVYLASVSAPRPGNQRRNVPDEPWAHEAREFTRQRLIGRKIRVKVEYLRGPPPNANDKTDRVYVAVYQGKSDTSIQEALVGEGLATVQKHRMNEPRSVHYDALLAAEQKAEKAKKCIHSKQKAPNHSCLDLSERFRIVSGETKEQTEVKQRVQSAKARTFHSAMKADGGVTGVVEHIFSGSRLKVFVPRENIMVSFVLAGVRCPATSAPGGKQGDPFGNEALQFTRNNCMQRDVKLEVETIDRGDNFIGTLRYGPDNTNLAVELLEQGLAEIYAMSAERSPYRDSLVEAEKHAKEARRGIWHNWTPPKPEENKESESHENEQGENSFGGESLDVRVTEVADATNFFVHISGNEALKFITEAMASFEQKNPAPLVPMAPKKGLLCAGRFTDGQWHRVRVEGRASEGQWRVFFIDYGNRDVLPTADLRPISDSAISSVQPLAVSCTLAALKPPAPGSEYAGAALEAFTEMCYDRDMVAKVFFRDSSRRLHVTLHHPDIESSVNEQLVEQGLARVQSRVPPPLRDLAAQFSEVEQVAKNKHCNIWEYGDVSDPEEEQDNPRAAAPVGRRH